MHSKIGAIAGMPERSCRFGPRGAKRRDVWLSALAMVDIYLWQGMLHATASCSSCRCIAAQDMGAVQEAPHETLCRKLTCNRSVTTFCSGTCSPVAAGDIGFCLSSGGASAVDINLVCKRELGLQPHPSISSILHHSRQIIIVSASQSASPPSCPGPLQISRRKLRKRERWNEHASSRFRAAKHLLDVVLRLSEMPRLSYVSHLPNQCRSGRPWDCSSPLPREWLHT